MINIEYSTAIDDFRRAALLDEFPSKLREAIAIPGLPEIGENKYTDKQARTLIEAFERFKTSSSERTRDLLAFDESSIMRDYKASISFDSVNRLSELPTELVTKDIGAFLGTSGESGLVATSRHFRDALQPKRVLTTFLECVAHGEQNKAEALFRRLYKDNVEKRQEALCHVGEFTDYSGRKFNCTAYEYAYWAKDKHMCRMLEGYMDNETKKIILDRINVIEGLDPDKPKGLSYQQGGHEYRSSHFDLSQLITALQEYVSGFVIWRDTGDLTEAGPAWMKVGMAQRDLPVHVVNEYCSLHRSFSPCPRFEEKALFRNVRIFNDTMNAFQKLYPLVFSATSGLGIDFALTRGHRKPMSHVPMPDSVNNVMVDGLRVCSPENAALDLAAVTHLDEVRSSDYRRSYDNIQPTPPEHGFFGGGGGPI